LASLEAVQERLTVVGDVAVAVRLAGTDGAVVSTVQLLVAGVGSVVPLAVAATLKVCPPSARPE
jgi:hypothetical protein